MELQSRNGCVQLRSGGGKVLAPKGLGPFRGRNQEWRAWNGKPIEGDAQGTKAQYLGKEGTSLPCNWAQCKLTLSHRQTSLLGTRVEPGVSNSVSNPRSVSFEAQTTQQQGEAKQRRGEGRYIRLRAAAGPCAPGVPNRKADGRAQHPPQRQRQVASR
jgi:hypothetical protein